MPNVQHLQGVYKVLRYKKTSYEDQCKGNVIRGMRESSGVWERCTRPFARGRNSVPLVCESGTQPHGR
jgi:hypothetical protein